MVERNALGCGESADIQAAALKTAGILYRDGELGEIPGVIRRIAGEAGWPTEIVELITGLAQSGELWDTANDEKP